MKLEGLGLSRDAEAVDPDDLAVEVYGRASAHTCRDSGADLEYRHEAAADGVLRADLSVLEAGVKVDVGEGVDRGGKAY